MKGVTLCALLILLLMAAGFPLKAQNNPATQKLTFDEAWLMTQQNSHVMKQVQYLQEEKNQSAKASRNLYLPTVGIAASYIFMSDNLHLDLTPVKNAITPLYSALANYGVFSDVPYQIPGTSTVIKLDQTASTTAVRQQLQTGLTQIQSANWDEMIQRKQFGVVAATMMWPIYAGGKINIANRAARIEADEVSEVSRQKQGELMSELAERYFGLCLARQAVKVRQDVYNGMEQHLSDAQKMQKQGLIANADVLHAQVFYAQSERELTKARRQVVTVNQALNNTLSTDKQEDIEPVSELFYLDSIEDVNYFKKLAEEKNPQLLQVDSKKKLAEEFYKAQRSEYLPEIGMTGTYNIVDKDLSTYMPNWMVGVALKWTLFDGAARYRKIKAASMKNNEVEEIRAKASSDIETMIQKLYNELNMYREQLTELETAKSFTEEYVRVREKAFHEEMSNATEVVDANLSLAQVRIERLQAMYNYDLSLARLLQYSGIPEEFANYRQRKDAKTESYVAVINPSNEKK
jgi:outer membrane protein TolC